MPGIVGIIDPLLTTDEPERLEQLDKMCCRIKHYERYRSETYVRGPLTLGHVDHEMFKRDLQPVNSSDGRYTLFLHGEIYSYDELKNEVDIKEAISISNLLMALYEKYENDFVFRLKGAFNIIIWDSKEKELIVVNDRYGLRPIYYSQYNSILYLASEVKAILTRNDISKKIDDSAIASLFFFGFVIGNNTYFESIKLLPPASFLVFKNNEISTSNYWDFNFLDKKEGKPQDYYEERLGDLILRAVQRHVKDGVRITVPLSGGLDSRTILASISKEYYPINTVTFGTEDMNDVKIAKRVSDALGTNHHCLEILPEDIINSAKKIVNITDGMISFLHSVGNMKLESIRDYTDVCLDGMEVIGSFFRPLDIFLGKEKFLVSNLFQPIPSNLARSLFTHFYYEKIKDYPRKIIRNISQKCKSVSVNNILDYYNFTERQRRFINYGNLVKRTFAEVRSPLFDNDLVDFIVSLPPSKRMYRGLYIRTFLRFFPEFSKIPWEKTGLPVDATNTFVKMTLCLIKKRLKKKLGGVSSINLFAKYTQWSRENEHLI
ncbi:MAG: asparagine synthetase B, partial [Flavobacteriaceae bacterium]|nr:asparagine synthetase B [Flavobacteriaceae bacterium]